MAALFLTRADLVACITAFRVIQYLDDDGDQVVGDDDDALVSIMEAAEAQYFSRMIRSLGRDAAVLLAQNDAVARKHVAWIACELASERRTEFTDAEGRGAYWVQYERALKEIDLLSKAQTRSVGEEQSGALANSGGYTSARDGTPPQFVFAPNRRDRTTGSQGSGGF